MAASMRSFFASRRGLRRSGATATDRPEPSRCRLRRGTGRGCDGSARWALVRRGSRRTRAAISHGAAAALVVPEPTIKATIQEVDVELRLADIDAGDCDGAGFVHSCVHVLLQFGSVPTLVLRSPEMDAAGQPSYRTDVESEGQAVRPPPPQRWRDLLPAATLACATCGTVPNRLPFNDLEESR